MRINLGAGGGQIDKKNPLAFSARGFFPKSGCQTPTLFAPFKRTSGPLPGVLDEFPFGGILGRYGRRQLLFGDKLATAQRLKRIWLASIKPAILFLLWEYSQTGTI